MSEALKKALDIISDHLKHNPLSDELKSTLDSTIKYINKSDQLEPKDITNIVETVENSELKEVVMTLEDKLIVKGKNEGIKIGIQQRSIEIARKMKAEGMSMRTIARITGLSINEINAL